MKCIFLKSQPGFTLIELVIYVGLLSMMTIMFAVFMTDIIKHSVRVVRQKDTAENARLVLTQISQEIKTASGDLNFISNHELQFKDVNGATARIYYDISDQSVWYDDSAQQFKLSSSAIKVTEFSLTLTAHNTVAINMLILPARKIIDSNYELRLQSAVVPRQMIY